MSEVRFPKKHDDGTFTVKARYSTSDPTVRGLVREYVEAWGRANAVWVRIWRSQSIEEERLELAGDFSCKPHVEFLDSDGFVVVFDGLASSTRWKDWAVRLTREVSSVFPEVRFERFESE